MIIQLKKIKDIEHKGYPFKEIVGVKGDGSEYTKRVIVGDRNADVLNALDEFGSGDFLELKYDTTKFRNITSVKEADGFPEQAPPQTGGGGGGKPQMGRRSDGTSRGDDTNRSAAIYLAKGFMEMTYPENELHVMSNGAFWTALISFAEVVRMYITEGADAAGKLIAILDADGEGNNMGEDGLNPPGDD